MSEEVMSLIILIAGILLCFCGFKIQKVLIMVVWFLIGYNLAQYVCVNFIDNGTLLIVISIVVGLLLAGVGYKLEKLALFIAVSYLVFKSIGSYIHIEDTRLAFMIHGAIALICGALSTLFIKVILIGVSSFAGAALIKEYLPLFITMQASILNIVVLVILVIGVIVQIKTS